jgi:transmembrane sensor
MNSHNPQSAVTTPPLESAADIASRWWLRLQQPEAAAELAAEFQQWLAADPLHLLYYQQCCELQQQLSGLSPVWQQQLLQAEPLSWADEPAAATAMATEVVAGSAVANEKLGQLAAVPAQQTLRPSLRQSLRRSHDKGAQPQALQHQRAQPRQIWWSRLAACVAMLAVCWLGWQSQPAELQSHWQTGVGQFASYQLPDGSEIKLDAATALEVHYGADERQVLLKQGQAWFEVAPDSNRPFVVLTPDSQVKVLGTGFAVSWFGSYSQVEVAHGKVEFSYPGEVRQLIAGQRLQGKPDSQISQLPVAAVASWRQGYLSFDQQPLSEVVIALNRYLAKPLRLADQSSAALLLTATFQLDQLSQLPTILPAVLPVQLEAQPTQWLIRQQGAATAFK